MDFNGDRDADRTANFAMLLRRAADDIRGGWQRLGGKGAADCDSHRLMVVAIGRPTLSQPGVSAQVGSGGGPSPLRSYRIARHQAPSPTSGVATVDAMLGRPGSTGRDGEEQRRGCRH